MSGSKDGRVFLPNFFPGLLQPMRMVQEMQVTGIFLVKRESQNPEIHGICKVLMYLPLKTLSWVQDELSNHSQTEERHISLRNRQRVTGWSGHSHKHKNPGSDPWRAWFRSGAGTGISGYFRLSAMISTASLSSQKKRKSSVFARQKYLPRSAASTRNAHRDMNPIMQVFSWSNSSSACKWELQGLAPVYPISIQWSHLENKIVAS